LRLSEIIWILLADNGNCTVVFDEFIYKKKVEHFAGVRGLYEPLPKDPTAKVRAKYRKSFPSSKLHSLSI
jgi:hypothetical protein